MKKYYIQLVAVKREPKPGWLFKHIEDAGYENRKTYTSSALSYFDAEGVANNLLSQGFFTIKLLEWTRKGYEDITGAFAEKENYQTINVDGERYISERFSHSRYNPKAKPFVPQAWQLDPSNLKTELVQLWSPLGGMTGRISLQAAREWVRSGKAWIISNQAIEAFPKRNPSRRRGIPAWLWLVGGAAVIGGIWYWRKKSTAAATEPKQITAPSGTEIKPT